MLETGNAGAADCAAFEHVYNKPFCSLTNDTLPWDDFFPHPLFDLRMQIITTDLHSGTLLYQE